ncbi:hypothetical protein J6590_008736 [Homalodisca vitripennis]|nr:hypothetical protein J6590_008736 [Homalodisca vitripennis]
MLDLNTNSNLCRKRNHTLHNHADVSPLVKTLPLQTPNSTPCSCQSPPRAGATDDASEPSGLADIHRKCDVLVARMIQTTKPTATADWADAASGRVETIEHPITPQITMADAAFDLAPAEMNRTERLIDCSMDHEKLRFCTVELTRY